jgi:hypothetical protein
MPAAGGPSFTALPGSVLTRISAVYHLSTSESATLTSAPCRTGAFDQLALSIGMPVIRPGWTVRAGRDQPLAPVEDRGVGAVPLSHLRRIGLGPVAASPAPGDYSCLGRRCAAEGHWWAGVGFY